MSEPCPPAFMRTAPPIEPGTPTAHSKPVSPAAAVRRASTGRATAEPATHSAPRDLDAVGPFSEAQRNACEPGVGDQQVRSPADHQDRKLVPGDHLGDAVEVVHRRRTDEDGRRAPDSIGRHRAEGLVDTSQWTEIRDSAMQALSEAQFAVTSSSAP